MVRLNMTRPDTTRHETKRALLSLTDMSHSMAQDDAHCQTRHIEPISTTLLSSLVLFSFVDDVVVVGFLLVQQLS